MASTGDDQELDREIAELEQRLADAKARRNPANGGQPSDSHSYSHSQPEPNEPRSEFFLIKHDMIIIPNP